MAYANNQDILKTCFSQHSNKNILKESFSHTFVDRTQFELMD